MTSPEALARQGIDALLTAAGWVVQERAAMNLGAGLGVAVREFPLATGPADYLQAPQDEPAGVLLARMKAERAPGREGRGGRGNGRGDPAPTTLPGRQLPSS